MSLFSDAHPPRTVLVAATRRIGDVLLTTPIVRSIKARWPDAEIDVLVFRGTEGVLEGNPDVRRVITVAQRARIGERLRDAMRIWRRYDLACAALSSDRPRFYTWFAGRKRVGLVDPDKLKWWTRLMLNRIALNRHETEHTVRSTLALADAIGIAPVSEVVAPGLTGDPAQRARFEAWFAPGPALRPGHPYVVLHPFPMFVYKRWNAEGWARLAAWLHARGFDVVLTGGPAEAERGYAEQVAALAGVPVLNLVGRLSLGESAEVFRRARLYVGPDTGATHIAAATGVPTLALYGPSDPVRWGPWPNGWPAHGNPWALVGSARHENIYLLQGEGECVPCRAEGCERRIDSPSLCLTDMRAERVIAAAAALLDLPPEAEAEPDAVPEQPVVLVRAAQPHRS